MAECEQVVSLSRRSEAEVGTSSELIGRIRRMRPPHHRSRRGHQSTVRYSETLIPAIVWTEDNPIRLSSVRSPVHDVLASMHQTDVSNVRLVSYRGCYPGKGPDSETCNTGIDRFASRTIEDMTSKGGLVVLPSKVREHLNSMVVFIPNFRVGADLQRAWSDRTDLEPKPLWFHSGSQRQTTIVCCPCHHIR